MSEEKEVLKKFKEKIDDLLPLDEIVKGLPGKGAELLDGFLISILVDYLYKKLPEEYHEEALSIMEAIISGEKENISEAGIKVIVSKLNTKLGDEKETKIAGNIWGILDVVFFGKQKEPGQGPIEPDPE